MKLTTRDRRLTCDECGLKYTPQFAPLHKCSKRLIQALQEIADMCCAPPNYSDQTMREIALAAIKEYENPSTI
jgi:hypothetical protein